MRQTTARPHALAAFTGIVLATAASPAAQAAVVVSGGLSNFDVTNTTGKDEYEFEIELPSVDPSAISSLWQNTSLYVVGGVPRGHDYFGTYFKGASSDGIAGHTSTFVDYKSPATAPFKTPPDFIEHFGIHFTGGVLNPAAIYTWKDAAGVPFNFSLPTVGVTATPNAAGGVTVTPVVTNNGADPVIVRFRSGVTTAHPDGVSLDNLVETNSEIQTVEAEAEAGDNGTGGVRLDPGQVLGIDGEAHDPTDGIIVDSAHWLATHPGDGLMPLAVDLNGAGDAALTTLDVFAASGSGNGAGARIGSFMSAVNTAAPTEGGPQPVPEPGSWLLAVGVAGLEIIRRRPRR